MRGHVDALWNAKIAMHNYVRQAIDIVAASGTLSPAHAAQMDLALRTAYVPFANTALAPAQPIPVTLTSANAPSPGSIVEAGRNAVSVASTVANVIDNVQWPNSARQELISHVAQHPGEFSTAEQAAELIDVLHPYSGSDIDPGQLATGAASTGPLNPVSPLNGSVPAGTATPGMAQSGGLAPGVFGGAAAASPGGGASTAGPAMSPHSGSVPLASGVVGPGAGRSAGGSHDRPARPGVIGSSSRGTGSGVPGSHAGGSGSGLRGGMPTAGATKVAAPDSAGQNSAHHGARSAPGAGAGPGLSGRPGIMMGGPMGGAGGRAGRASETTGAKAVTSQVEREGNLRDLLGDRPAVVPGVIGSWVFEQPDNRR
ncbi:hypothetical protein [Corynebacterium guangdongense]|uniref:PPE family protein n=1 Tax=Corynebacterium guangdongense TaxID=1783348 RepID=A0ABU1ZXL2_9CORY|nr:hypothetical protein [Corynebacterium guangdongense]MDR7329674.1 hypothetical protein [Corynebacterium guangdongense]